MQSTNLNVEPAGLQNTIVQASRELIVLQRSLTESLESWKAFGFDQVRNPVAESLQRDIESREEILKLSRQALADFFLNQPPLTS
jgi:hypothetical protein